MKIHVHVYLMPRTNRSVGYPTTEWTVYGTRCTWTPSWYCWGKYSSSWLIFIAMNGPAILFLGGKLCDCTQNWPCCLNLPPPLVKIGGIGGRGNMEPVGCIKLVGGIDWQLAPASWAAACGQMVSAQFGSCHWLPAPGPPLLPQYESVAKLSWLPEHCSRWGRGGDDCLE